MDLYLVRYINGPSFAYFVMGESLKLKEELNVAKDLAVLAGNKIVEIYNSEDCSVDYRENNGPLTKADLESNRIIVEGLRKNFPDFGILTEEGAKSLDRLSKEFVWIVDPLDGTKEFIARNGEFTVNIALVYNGNPVLGVVYLPVQDILFFSSKEEGAFCQRGNELTKLHVSDRFDINEMVLIKSRNHSSEREKTLINHYKFKKVESAGSSLKGGLIAKGDVDIYFRFGDVNEWDICAMDAILRGAGGDLTNLDGVRLKYNGEDFLVRGGFLASNGNIHNYLLALEEMMKDGSA